MKSTTAWLLMSALLASGCANANNHKPSPGSCCSAAASPASGPFTDKSLFQLDSTWTTDSSQPIKLGALRGRPQVLIMFFASCRYTCPLIINDLKQIEAALPANLRPNVGFTLVSFDSERDTPEALHALRAGRGLTGNNWTLLHGEPEEVRELAMLLGINYRKEVDGQFSHSNLITILNAEGEIVYQQAGFNQAPNEVVQRLTRMLRRNPAPPHES
jgi:protein SCO1/2